MANKIYILPQYGKYEGTLLVFDYVENMTHNSTSKVPQHPVESFGRSIADHRYREGLKIHLTGNISNNWESGAQTVNTSPFQTQAFKEQEILRRAVNVEYPAGSPVSKAVNEILDVKATKNAVLLKYDIPPESTYLLSIAESLVKQEKDIVSVAEGKNLSLNASATNDRTLGRQINTIAQGEELLKYLDDTSTLVTVYSMYRTYENMVITNFSNILRNGVERGAYWFNLSFEQQLVASTVTKPLAIDPVNSEKLITLEERGKVEIGVDPVLRTKVSAIYEEVLKKYVSNYGNKVLSKITDADRLRIIEKGEDAFRKYRPEIKSSGLNEANSNLSLPDSSARLVIEENILGAINEKRLK